LTKIRLDQLLVDRGLAPSRERARALILAGQAQVDGRAVSKAGAQVAPEADVTLLAPDHPYVSRGGLKLAHALETFGIAVEGRDALDIGASTGGFTDVLLQRGAARVVALDVGHGQLDWRLRRDPRVVDTMYAHAVSIMDSLGARLSFERMLAIDGRLDALTTLGRYEQARALAREALGVAEQGYGPLSREAALFLARGATLELAQGNRVARAEPAKGHPHRAILAE